MPLTDKLSDVAVYMQTRLEALGTFQDVFFGDQELIPRYPAASVEPVQMSRDFAGLPFQTLNNFSIYVHIYFGTIGDTQASELACGQYAEQVLDYLHQDPQMGDLVTYAFARRYEMGQAVRNNNQLLRACRISWEAVNKTGVGQ